MQLTQAMILSELVIACDEETRPMIIHQQLPSGSEFSNQFQNLQVSKGSTTGDSRSAMSPNFTTIGDGQMFRQRWEFRKNDCGFDSSSDDSKSNSLGQPVLNKHKLASSLILLDDDDISNSSRLEQNHSGNPDLGDQVEFSNGKEREFKRGKSKSNNIADPVTKNDFHEAVNRNRSKFTVYDPVAIDGVRNLRESLMVDLNATRENMFTWMREEMNKLAADDNAPKKGSRKRNSRGKKVLRSQWRNNLEKNEQLQQQNSVEGNVQVQHQINNGAIVGVQQKNAIEESTRVQCRKNFKSSTRFRKGSGGSLERFSQSMKSSEIIDQVACGQATGPLTSSEREKGERSALTVSLNCHSDASKQNVKVQHPKKVVLAIRAQNCNDGSRKGMRTGNFKKRCQSREAQVSYSQAIGSMASTEKEQADRFRLSVGQSLLPTPAVQVASSMYLTLPTVLTKPHDSNNRLDTFLSNYIQPRLSGNRFRVNLEEAKQMHDSSTQFGYLPSIHPEERTGNFGQMGSGNMSYFNHSGNHSSITGTGYPIPLHQGSNTGFRIPSEFLLQNILQESDNTSGLQMNGGAITFSGGSYGLSENFVTNNLLSQSNYIADGGRLTPYPLPSYTDDYVFPK